LMSILTSDQRDVIALRIVADLPLAEVAKIIGKPVTAVKRLQARALRRLQREILDREVSE
jgi:RNA polymerase sigma factor (sigma-70 family)